jgi:hypothetical protein
LGFAPPKLAELVKPAHQQPLEFLLSVMEDTSQLIATRVDAAKAAAPYVHFRKGLIDTTGRDVPLMIQVVRFSDGEQLEAPRPILDVTKVIEMDTDEDGR